MCVGRGRHEGFFSHCSGMQGDELRLKYKRVSPEDAEQGWKEVYEASLNSCMHGAYCQAGAECQVRRDVCSNLFVLILGK